MKFGLPQDAIGKIGGVLASHSQVEKALLYGSRAKGNFRKGSDIDLTLTGDRDLTLDILLKIRDEIDDLLLPYTVDLSLLSNISDPHLLDHIERVAQVFYSRASSPGSR